MNEKKGIIIAAFGIPGSGKSTTTKEIGKLLNIKTFHEPEEGEWSEAVKDRNIVGNFTALMWFRSIRIPQYFKAMVLKENGETVMLDSCYDKLFYLYYNREGIEWLISKDDPYYSEMISIAEKDYQILQDIDVLVFFKQTEENWKKFISKRNRKLDQESEFKKSFILQEAFLDAVKQYCEEKKCELIIHEQSFSNPKVEAEKIAEKLSKYL